MHRIHSNDECIYCPICANVILLFTLTRNSLSPTCSKWMKFNPDLGVIIFWSSPCIRWKFKKKMPKSAKEKCHLGNDTFLRWNTYFQTHTHGVNFTLFFNWNSFCVVDAVQPIDELPHYKLIKIYSYKITGRSSGPVHVCDQLAGPLSPYPRSGGHPVMSSYSLFTSL